MPSEFRDDVKEILDELLLGVPGVTGGQAFGYPAYKVGRKIFAFVGGSGLCIKLNEARVSELVAENDEMTIFTPDGTRMWKAWLSIDRTNADDYAQDMPLFMQAQEAIGAGKKHNAKFESVEE